MGFKLKFMRSTMSVCATILIVIATILGPITLVFMSVSFGTDHWLEFRVDRSKLPANLRDTTDLEMAKIAHSRDRGLFRECFPGNDTQFLDKADGKVDGYCFNINYDMPEISGSKSDEYISRLHLNRCFLAFFIIAIVLFLLAYVFGLILCCMRVSRWAYIAGLFSYSAAFSLAAAIAFFHGAEYIERNKLKDQYFYLMWDEPLKTYTTRNYGWSYALGWVGMILAALSATFYSLAGCYITSEKYEDREVLEKQKGRDYPIAMEPVYAVGTDPYYTKSYGYPRAYLGPMAPEYYARSYPAVGYGDPSKDMWHWREMES